MNTHKFDVAGLIVLVVMLLSLNVVITKGAALGYTLITVLWFDCNRNCSILYFLKR